jgi:DNA-binding protein HU-beta
MSKAFIAAVLQDSIGCTGVKANIAANELIEAIVSQIKEEGFFTLPSFGTFKKATAKGGQRLNPRTGAKVMVEDYATVRFKASPVLRKLVEGRTSSRQPVASKTVKVAAPVEKSVRQPKVSKTPVTTAQEPQQKSPKKIKPVVVEAELQPAAPLRKKPGPKPGSKRVTKTKAHPAQ